METYDFLALLNSHLLRDKKAVITIGVFDGVHLGHQSLIKSVVMEAKKRDAVSICITFSSNPKKGSKGNIDSLRLREEMVKKLGVNYFVVIDFTRDFSNTSARRFIDMLLSLCLPVAIIVGDDFRFGSPSSSASAQDLSALLLESGCKAEVIIEKAILTQGGEKISSTLVRRVIEKGELSSMPSLIGRRYCIDVMPCPFIVKANSLVIATQLIHQLLPPPGVYASSLDDGIEMMGKLEIGRDFISFTSPHLSSYLSSLEKSGVGLNSIFIGEGK